MYYEIESRFNMKRIVFDDDKMTVGDKEYPYAEIEKIDLSSMPLFSTYGIMNVQTGGKNIAIPYPRSEGEKIRRALSELERESENHGASGNTQDPYEEAKKLKELLDLGIVTQEEFERKKKEILGL